MSRESLDPLTRVRIMLAELGGAPDFEQWCEERRRRRRADRLRALAAIVAVVVTFTVTCLLPPVLTGWQILGFWLLVASAMCVVSWSLRGIAPSRRGGKR